MSIMKKIWGLFMIFIVATSNGEAHLKKRICVIGAGRAGLAAIKTIANQTDNFELVAFERNSDVGGLWIYRNDPYKDDHGLPIQTGVIYKNLKTNLLKEYMIYPDYPTIISKERNYISHKTFLKYMRNYTDHFYLRRYIKFNTNVTNVIPKKGNGDWRTTTWRMETQNLNTNETNLTNCDAVIVCNGHYSKPNIPKIPGLIETFPGRVLHSITYRKPEDFTNKTVVLLGAGTSGVDISIDLSKYAKTVYLSHRKDEDPFEYEVRPSNVQVVRGVVAANGSKLILQGHSTIVADTFMFCTGYLYDFPFLDDRSGIFIIGKEVHPLYDQEINAIHPSMAFISLNDDVVFGGTCLYQSEYFLNVLQGIEELPLYQQVLKNHKM